jgi:hypothetical protein
MNQLIKVRVPMIRVLWESKRGVSNEKQVRVCVGLSVLLH